LDSCRTETDQEGDLGRLGYKLSILFGNMRLRRVGALWVGLEALIGAPDLASGGWLWSSSEEESSELEEDALNLLREFEPDEAGVDLGGACAVRGVPGRDKEKFSGLRFLCDNGALEAPIEMVNDEYCDCEDGTDEPGTSACSSTEVETKFFCANEGYKGMKIPASRVGDDICDCCDGTDEAPGLCENTCVEDGIEFRKAREQFQKLQEEGQKKKAEYVDMGKGVQSLDTSAQIKELEEKLAELTREREAIEVEITQMENEQEKKEQEAERALAGARIEALQLKKLSREDLENLMIDLVIEGGTPDALESLVQDKLGTSEIEWLTKNDDESDSQELLDARSKKIQISTEESKLRKEEDSLAKEGNRDYGPENQYYAIRDKCFKKQADGYNYEICIYGKAKQNSVNLGSWEGFVPGSNYQSFKFSKGARCWNGPPRSLTVNAKCGPKEEIIQVKEPSMCEYVMDFITPAAC